MQKYSELLKKYDDLKQYSITFPGDYSEKIGWNRYIQEHKR
jgi:hypothetical protein